VADCTVSSLYRGMLCGGCLTLQMRCEYFQSSEEDLTMTRCEVSPEDWILLPASTLSANNNGFIPGTGRSEFIPLDRNIMK
jgi:hypothetical protein